MDFVRIHIKRPARAQKCLHIFSALRQSFTSGCGSSISS